MLRTALSFSIFVLLSQGLSADEREIDFASDVRPILSDKCFSCHGPDSATRETELRFDSEESAKSDLGGYRAIVAGDPDNSELIERITTDDESMVMPPVDSHLSLTTEQKNTLRAWIKQGAKWSEHWAYVEPKKWPTPQLDSDWPENWIDQFILQRLNREDLLPSQDTDQVTLARRLYFDLIGLPPTPEQVDKFTRAEQTFEQLVDELLASPHFGERFAVYWLDLVRFADTVGYHGDQDHSITPYRDWVIDAFNDNMPFDQFTREQLAGDMLEESSIDQKIASGYNRLLQTSHEGGVQPKEYLAIYAADRVRNVSEVWMGATVGCAQCHDHKYDPYTAKDFYSLAAFFDDIDDTEHLAKGTNSLPTARPPEIEVLSKRERKELEELKSTRDKIKSKPEDDSTESLLNELEKQITALESGKRRTMITVSLEEPRVTRVLPRGNWLDESGEIVPPSVPEFMQQIEKENRATRLDLANWLTDADSGTGLLTARVFVNRLWAQFFGAGLCPSLDDFGGQGQPPVHLELLDRLAIEFVESGWDVKHMIRLMITSRAYRQTSVASEKLYEIDPYNHLFARQSNFRLPAEFVRDNALAVGGLLNRKIGGASVKPYQPADYYRHLNFPTRKYKVDDDPTKQWRRGLYVHWQRQFLHPMLYAFDAPRREECTAQRAKSNTPSAALVLLNDPTFVESAKALALTTIKTVESDDDRIQFVFRQVLSRNPDDYEKQLVMDLLNTNRSEFTEESANQLLAIGVFNIPENIDVIELASWTMIARMVLNSSEATTRN